MFQIPTQNIVLTSGPKKRLFTPTFDTYSNHSKIRKDNAGLQLVDSQVKEILCQTFESQTDKPWVSINQNLAPSKIPKPKSFTVPKPFNFLTEERAQINQACAKHDHGSQLTNARPIFKARKAPRTTLTFQSRSESLKSKSIEPFYQFKALPLNKSILEAPDFQLRRGDKKYTVPMEINLSTADRSRLSTSSCDDYVSEFKARPMPKFKPFEIKRENREAIQPLEIELNSTKRAKEREQFDEYMKNKENMILSEKQRDSEMKMEVEAEDLKNFRKTLEFKARPLQDISPFLAQRSFQALTVPESPSLATKERSLKKNLFGVSNDCKSRLNFLSENSLGSTSECSMMDID